MTKKAIKEKLKKIVSSYNALSWNEVPNKSKLHDALISDGDLPFYRKDIFRNFSLDNNESTELANTLTSDLNTIDSLADFLHKAQD